MPTPGRGSIDCHVLAGRLQLTSTCAYPLKIISPQAYRANKSKLYPAVSYLLSYGGGIVHGDRIHITIKVGEQCALLLLTQGSTKVFRKRVRHQQIEYKEEDSESYQTIEVKVEDESIVCLLPDPVTCFENARYNQRQIIRIVGKDEEKKNSGSVVLLDWVTSGRMSRGERWCFDKYFSINLVMFGDKLVIRDALLLEDGVGMGMERMDVFAYLLLLGPLVVEVADALRAEHRDRRIGPSLKRTESSTAKENVWWSVSEVDSNGVYGIAIRAASTNTDDLKCWIKTRLAPLQNILGDSAWSMYFNS
ncbi:UreD-domain-containing protein [Coemansia reversa NRRL 1564]|uniref:UreD-domain-containing protein n=1 Tax=Coemansia reversa (strain ATCC 12441 / NRRL 1564) TaxID=763665 RepID=A0A2G5BB07_COERN|nr:UreD-domain-containing protein [Coemansia reversa NRRL 1564]|eukprot:PIA16196.1 UreD-domain-containing protein [Coemansia reversa NRRL 1564]